MSVAFSKNSPSYSDVFAFQQVSKSSPSIAENQSLLEMIADSGIFQVIGSAGFDFPNFPETQKKFKVLYLNLSDDFSSLMGILNGLIHLGQPSGVVLQYEKELDRFNLKFYLHDEELVRNYLVKLFASISGEKRFRKVLRRVIEVEKARKVEEKFLYQELLA
ncbi:hypothetical protein [Mongoliibacter ruber]|uniref:Uncharacterized protein n=1 Tax=Mongoliibacter ruber TaxID=1750599 RepID=A0A2T0WG52_9BACT|nr:hypothetical protein [Mongoliibacter ruber]PRY85687.1 hypothetical protein CLW00_11129 [Mongoliibacter ruber]